MQSRGCRVSVGVANQGLQSCGGGCIREVAESGWGLQGRGRRDGVGVAKNWSLNTSCNVIIATPTPTLQPLLCNPHPNSATPPLQPLPELCNPNFVTPSIKIPAFPVAERRQRARVRRSFSLEFSSFPSRHRCRAGCTSPRHAAGCIVDCIVNSELPRFCFLRYVSQVRHPLRNFLT